MTAIDVDRGHQIRQRHLAAFSYFFQSRPESIFEANAGRPAITIERLTTCDFIGRLVSRSRTFRDHAQYLGGLGLGGVCSDETSGDVLSVASRSRLRFIRAAQILEAAAAYQVSVLKLRFRAFGLKRTLNGATKVVIGSPFRRPKLNRVHPSIVAENRPAGMSASSASVTSNRRMTSPSTRASTPSILCGRSSWRRQRRCPLLSAIPMVAPAQGPSL